MINEKVINQKTIEILEKKVELKKEVFKRIVIIFAAKQFLLPRNSI